MVITLIRRTAQSLLSARAEWLITDSARKACYITGSRSTVIGPKPCSVNGRKAELEQRVTC